MTETRSYPDFRNPSLFRVIRGRSEVRGIRDRWESVPAAAFAHPSARRQPAYKNPTEIGLDWL
jgi:hypothetical protein